MKPILIAVAGGSASGKTTVVRKILDKLDCKDVLVITQDDYYNDLSELSMEERKNINFDHPDSLDSKLLLEQLKDLLNNKPILKPKYDFSIHNRSKEKEYIEPKKIFILYGILTLRYPNILKLADIKIFVESDDDLRFIRRLLRDTKERGRTIESVVEQYISTVKPMYHQFVKPSKRNADIIIPNDSKHDVAVEVIVGKIRQILNEK